MTAEALTAERCAIVLDSTSDLPDCRERHANMRMVPLTVRFGDEELLDYEEISPQRFYERLAGDPQPPRTAAPPPERFALCYRELFERDGFEHVLSLHLSEALSATVGSARLAAAEFDGRVSVVDTRTVSIGLALAALGVARQLDDGPCALADLVATAEGFHKRSRLVFAFETLEFLQRNGRIGRGQALVGGLLGVRPLLTLVDGEVEPLGRVRGHARLLAELERLVCEDTRPDERLRVGVAHAQAEDIANDIAETVRLARPEAVIELVAPLGAVVGTNTGPGGAGLVWARESG
jgi:fatty acid kinase fatty acid binding subunit